MSRKTKEIQICIDQQPVIVECFGEKLRFPNKAAAAAGLHLSINQIEWGIMTGRKICSYYKIKRG